MSTYPTEIDLRVLAKRAIYAYGYDASEAQLTELLGHLDGEELSRVIGFVRERLAASAAREEGSNPVPNQIGQRESAILEAESIMNRFAWTPRSDQLYFLKQVKYWEASHQWWEAQSPQTTITLERAEASRRTAMACLAKHRSTIPRPILHLVKQGAP